MTAMNVVHLRVKPGREDEFLQLHRDMTGSDMPGAKALWVVKTASRCVSVSPRRTGRNDSPSREPGASPPAASTSVGRMSTHETIASLVLPHSLVEMDAAAP